MKSYDKDRSDEKLHKYIHIKNKNTIGFVDTTIGGDLNVMKNIETNTLNVKKIGYDISGNDASGYAQFLDVSMSKLTIFGDAVINGTLEINNILRKTMTEIDIVGDLDLNNKLDVSGLFTTHGGININGNSSNNKINNVNIGYDISGKAAFTDLSCTMLNAGAIDIDSLDSCVIGSIIPSSANFTLVKTDNLTVGDGNNIANILPNGEQDIVIKTNGINFGEIKINHTQNGNININPNGSGSVVIPKIDINNGIIKTVDINNSNFVSGLSNIIDISNSIFKLSYDQQTDILKKGSLNNNSDIDFQDYNVRAKTINADSLLENKIIYTGVDGLLSTESGFGYNPISNELTVQNISSFKLTGSSDFNSQPITNINIDSGTIDNTTIANSNINVGTTKTIDVQYGSLVTSVTQDVDSFHRALINNNSNVDIQGYTLRAYDIIADSLSTNRMVFTGSDGKLLVEDDLQYDTSINELTVGRINSFQCTGAIDFNDQSANNAKINNATIENSDVSSTNIKIGVLNTLNVESGQFITSNQQDINIFQSGASNNNKDIDIQNYDLRASTITSDSLDSGQVVYTGDNGRLTSEAGFEYNTTANTMTLNNLTCNGLFSISQQVNSVTASSPSSPINISYTKTSLITTSTDYNFTLPDSAEGHVIIIYFKSMSDTNSAIVTPFNLHNGNTITYSSIGDNTTLLFTDNKWLITSSFGNIIVT